MVSGLLSIVNVISCVRTLGGPPQTSFSIEKQLQIGPDLSSFTRKILIFDRFFADWRMIEWSYILFDATIVSAAEICIIDVFWGSRGHARLKISISCFFLLKK